MLTRARNPNPDAVTTFAGCCTPVRGKLAAIQRDWADSDGELLALADPPVYQDAQEALQIAGQYRRVSTRSADAGCTLER